MSNMMFGGSRGGTKQSRLLHGSQAARLTGGVGEVLDTFRPISENDIRQKADFDTCILKLGASIHCEPLKVRMSVKFGKKLDPSAQGSFISASLFDQYKINKIVCFARSYAYGMYYGVDPSATHDMFLDRLRVLLEHKIYKSHSTNQGRTIDKNFFDKTLIFARTPLERIWNEFQAKNFKFLYENFKVGGMHIWTSKQV